MPTLSWLLSLHVLALWQLSVFLWNAKPENKLIYRNWLLDLRISVIDVPIWGTLEMPNEFIFDTPFMCSRRSVYVQWNTTFVVYFYSFIMLYTSIWENTYIYNFATFKKLLLFKSDILQHSRKCCLSVIFIQNRYHLWMPMAVKDLANILCKWTRCTISWITYPTKLPIP